MCYNDTTMRFLLLALNPIISLREKCPNTEFFSDPYFSAFRLNTGKYGKHRVKSIQIRSFFWSLFSRISTEYGEILCISPFCVRMRESTDQQKLRIWTFFTQCFSFQLQFSHYGHGPSKILRNIQGFQNCQGGSLFKSLSNI